MRACICACLCMCVRAIVCVHVYDSELAHYPHVSALCANMSVVEYASAHVRMYVSKRSMNALAPAHRPLHGHGHGHGHALCSHVNIRLCSILSPLRRRRWVPLHLSHLILFPLRSWGHPYKPTPTPHPPTHPHTRTPTDIHRHSYIHTCPYEC